MKTGTLDNPKTTRSLKRTGMARYELAGILEVLWQLTASHAPRGDVGRFSDQEIADYLGYEGDAGELIASLVELRWLDRSVSHRLLVHDWDEHAPDYIKKRLNRNKAGWAVEDDGGKQVPPTATGDQGVPLADEGEQQPPADGDDSECQTLADDDCLPNQGCSVQTISSPNQDTVNAGSWESVEEDLRRLGMNASKAAVESAQFRKLTVADALTLISEFKEADGGYTVNALHARFTGNLNNWPPPGEEQERQQQRAAADEARKRRAREHEQQKAKVEAERARAQDLECEFGPILDAMSIEDRQAFAQEVIPDPDVRKMTGQHMLREQLLEALATQNGAAV